MSVSVPPPSPNANPLLPKPGSAPAINIVHFFNILDGVGEHKGRR